MTGERCGAADHPIPSNNEDNNANNEKKKRDEHVRYKPLIKALIFEDI